MNLYNPILITGFVAWVASLAAKAFTMKVVHHEFSWKRVFGDGGMPSSHSATVAAVALATGLRMGFDSAPFAIALILALIVMHDARGVRQETGKQAMVINDMLALFDSMGKGNITPEETLKEFVGHTGPQVWVGGALGLVVAFLLRNI